MKEKIKMLYDKVAYKNLLELENGVTESNELYNYFDELLNMLKHEKTFVRVRTFRLICALAKCDKCYINNNGKAGDEILFLYEDKNVFY